MLVTADDLAEVWVRFTASKDYDNKAEVDWVGLRLAELTGETTLDAAGKYGGVNAASVWAAGNTGSGDQSFGHC